MAAITTEVLSADVKILGVPSENGGHEFRGIRFAQAERFSPPIDIHLSGDVDATSYGPIAFQTPGFLEQTLGLDSSAMSEDCLSLNVFVPEGTTTDSSLPVLFWIHGGAYTNGAGSLAWYHGSRLASRSCVVVTINYRLGIFGFLGTENIGVQDMVSALRWTNRHISLFGGNPDNVTIFGESAGGSAVVSLLATEAAQPYFHKAWAMSPSIGQLRQTSRAREIFGIVTAEAEERFAKPLSDLSAEDLLAVQDKLLGHPSKEYDWFAPTADGTVVSTNLLDTAASSSKPFVIGTNKDENKLWAAFDPSASEKSQDDWQHFLQRVFPSNWEDARRIYESHRPGETPHFLMSAVNTDTAFRSRAWELLRLRLHQVRPSWMYWFTWETPAFGGILGSCHALDIPFFFDNLDAPGGDMLTGSDPIGNQIAERCAAELVHFAYFGHPTWAQYNEESRPTLVINSDITLVNDPESEIRQLFTAQ